jgi:hypothetical protein
MKRKRYTEPQIVFALQQAEGSAPSRCWTPMVGRFLMPTDVAVRGHPGATFTEQP